MDYGRSDLVRMIESIKDCMGESTGYTFNDNYARDNIIPFLKKFGHSEVVESLRISISMYYDKNDVSSISKILDKLGGILHNRSNNLTPVQWTKSNRGEANERD